MNFNCMICFDVFTQAQAEDVYVTQCGHIFHYHCMINWVERSNTCPQCRNETSGENIHKVYFNFINGDSTKDEAARLQCKLNNIQSEIKLMDQELKHYTDKYKKMNTQNIGLRAEVQELKERLSFLKNKANEKDNSYEEISRLRTKLKEANNVAASLKKSLFHAERRKCDAYYKLEQTLTEVLVQKRECSRLQTENTKLKEDLIRLQDFVKKQWQKEEYMREELSHCEEGHTADSKNNRGSKRTILERSIPLPKKSRTKLDHNMIDSDDSESSIDEDVKYSFLVYE